MGSGDNFGLNYDKEKYKEMLPDADETVLGVDSLWNRIVNQRTKSGGWN